MVRIPKGGRLREPSLRQDHETDKLVCTGGQDCLCRRVLPEISLPNGYLPPHPPGKKEHGIDQGHLRAMVEAQNGHDGHRDPRVQGGQVHTFGHPMHPHEDPLTQTPRGGRYGMNSGGNCSNANQRARKSRPATPDQKNAQRHPNVSAYEQLVEASFPMGHQRFGNSYAANQDHSTAQNGCCSNSDAKTHEGMNINMNPLYGGHYGAVNEYYHHSQPNGLPNDTMLKVEGGSPGTPWHSHSNHHTTMYSIPFNSATAHNPMTWEQQAMLQQDPQFYAQQVSHNVAQGITGVAASSAEELNPTNPAHNCQCGDGCQCHMCVVHPYNSQSIGLVNELAGMLHEDEDQVSPNGTQTGGVNTQPSLESHASNEGNLLDHNIPSFSGHEMEAPSGGYYTLEYGGPVASSFLEELTNGQIQ